MRVILYGCGDFSYVIEYLQETLQMLKMPAFQAFDPSNWRAHVPVDVMATELRNEEQLRRQYGARVMENIGALTRSGVNVQLGVDAVNHPFYGPFDLVIFRNPHTGNYGSSADPSMVSYVESIGSNSQLFDGVLKQTARTRVPYGLVLITVVGWPYLGKNPKGSLGFQGLQLENAKYAIEYGERAGLEFLQHINLGQKWVARNTGGTFVADEIGLLYRDATKWRDIRELEHTMRAYDEANLPAWTRLHPEFEAMKRKLATGQ
ncbi:Rossmann-like fold-containing protein [Nocardia altamirensis]|uniref:Rossmann-like fold-containing protein n=1 Tax=Nocardia altamirensis TaxID=472158 RepID=UPI00084090E3|nr:Rossmann-like fold-containing protein [Nocardia altamirensis]